MDITKQLSFEDLIAYLVPGIISSFGILTGLMLSPLKNIIEQQKPDLFTSILFLVFAFGLGAILSAPANIFVEGFYRVGILKDPRKAIFPPHYEPDVLALYKKAFNRDSIDWTEEDLRIVLLFIQVQMPEAYEHITRSGAFRKLYRSLMTTVMIWSLVGVFWGYNLINNGVSVWGRTLIYTSPIIGIFLLVTMLLYAHKNREREVRDTFAAFLVGNALKTFSFSNEERQKYQFE